MTSRRAPRATIDVGGRLIGPEAEIYLVAETACAHQGRLETLLALVDAAADAGCDAIQFEMFDAPNNMVSHAPMFELISKLQLSTENWKAAFTHARRRNLAIFGYVYDRPSLAVALELGPDALKLNASDLCNPELLDGVARSGLPFTLGVGAATLEEISQSLDYVLERGGDAVALMHGVQSFPTPPNRAQIGRIRLLRETFRALVGYADHTSGADPAAGWIDAAAIGAGACLLEKHVILDADAAADGVDRQAALSPNALRDYVARMRVASSAIGRSSPQPLMDYELTYRRFQRKVVVAARPIAKNSPLSQEDVIFLRHPEEGLPPFDLTEFLGHATLRAILPGEPIRVSDLTAPIDFDSNNTKQQQQS